ncbi:MAG: ATP-dependent zinc metalloprotease FtsH [Gemmatimonadetes bacterium]|nr:ATP-dependent zinc metalloprotease FtsH [Gemmatimonadota bacterium]
MVALLVPLTVFQFMNAQQRDTAQLNYSEFRRELDEDNIASITVRAEDGEAIGEFRVPRPRARGGAPAGDEGAETNFRLFLPNQELGEDVLAALLDRGVAIDSEPARSNWFSLIVPMLPFILILGLWLFLFRQMQAGGTRAFSFGKSRAKLLTGDTPKVDFSDVAGCDEAKDELREIIEFLKDPRRFSRLGGRLPKGALLVGPPGTGKTLLARAVAGEAKRPFFSMSGSDFVEMFVGVGASRVRDLFEQSKTQAPCIVFIDEIDAVGRHRGAGLGGGHDEREQTLNQLLVEMDGFESAEGVILVAATNRPDVLDPALLRPGRFDRQIVVDNPDIRGREGIFRVHTQDIPLGDDVDLGVLAKGTPGLSGADIANVVNEAALIAARDDKDRVYMCQFELAKDKIMLGTERRSMVISAEERRVTAYHEAGHAVVALKVPGLDPLHKVTIVPRGRALGITASLPEEDRHTYTLEWLRGRLQMLFGGRVAEEMVLGQDKITTGAGDDIERATDLARRMVTQFGMSEAVGPMAVGENQHEVFLGRDLTQRREVSEKTAELVDGEVKRILGDAYKATERTLSENEDLLTTIAEALLDRETLDADDIKRLANGDDLPDLAEPPPPEPPPAPADLKPEKAPAPAPVTPAPAPAPV